MGVAGRPADRCHPGRRGTHPAAQRSRVRGAQQADVASCPTMADENGRPDLSGLRADRTDRLFHVGRLDTDTSGLLVLTNDGDLAHQLAHPSFEITKTYVALVDGAVSDSRGGDAASGHRAGGRIAQVDRFVVKNRGRGQSMVELDIHMGRNRIVRRLLAEVGHPVVELTRTAFGPLRPRGLCRRAAARPDPRRAGRAPRQRGRHERAHGRCRARPVLVIGCGLIGTSLALALTEAGVAVHLADVVAANVELAVSRGAGTADPVVEPALVVVAVPPIEVAACVAVQALADLRRPSSPTSAASRSTCRPQSPSHGERPFRGRSSHGRQGALRPDGCHAATVRGPSLGGRSAAGETRRSVGEVVAVAAAVGAVPLHHGRRNARRVGRRSSRTCHTCLGAGGRAAQ